MIHWREQTKTDTWNVPFKAVCDIGGEDATGKTVMGQLVASRFQSYRRNTEENTLNTHAAIGESVMTGVAEFCEYHGEALVIMIDELANDFGGPGVRKPDEGGN